MEKNLKQFKKVTLKFLQTEIACTQALAESLKNECSAITSLDEKLITRNSANKQRLIQDLQTATMARVDLMSEHNFDPTPSGISECIELCDYTGELKESFAKLSIIAQQCFEENQIVGQLINRRSQFISQTLHSLSPTLDTQTIIYGRDGSTGNQSNLHSLASI